MCLAEIVFFSSIMPTGGAANVEVGINMEVNKRSMKGQ
jgi:hypothetical protein